MDCFSRRKAQAAREAKALFEKLEREKESIVVSYVHIKEMRNQGFYEEYERAKNEMYKTGLCFGVAYGEEDRQIALKQNEFLEFGFDDCLHLQIAKKTKAKPVSYDKHWFAIAEKINLRVYRPKELL
ncbi:MAG: hypothetical protein V1911_03400 [Candidatus Micrarchaeota archaeon]